MSYIFPSAPLRDAILSSIPEGSSQFGMELFSPSFLYAPVRHSQAVDPNTMLVVGNRGAGKSLWWAALRSPNHRRVIARTLPKAGLPSNLEVRAGFGTGVPIKEAPSKDVLAKLLREFEPREIWRAIVGWQVLGETTLLPVENWPSRVTWVRNHPEEFESALDDADEKLLGENRTQLVVFDALDTAADTWTDLRRLLRGLLQVTLEFRARRRIRLKVFVRPDMLEDPEVANFPDASKVLGSKALLSWTLVDLYGLLWQMLGNAPEGGKEFREGTQTGFNQKWVKVEESWTVPNPLCVEEELQRSVFHAISGPWMGPNPKRGFPYTWLPNHLADSFGQASPRSFQVALREAAVHHPPSGWPYALHHEGIRRGVQAASGVRVRELTEDYPWVEPAMEALRNKVIIPCSPLDLHSTWKSHDTLKEVARAATASAKLGPRRLEKGAEGLIQDLEELGIFQRLPDGRLQMPDVYRVAFGLGRKGGIRPLR
jgi:hypothetical protein